MAESSPRHGHRRHTTDVTVAAVEPKAGRPLLRLFFLASITVSFLAASSAPTPLYATYQAAWGFSALTTTVIFGVYAVALLAALLTAGRLSDHIGRRPVLLAGIAGQVLALLTARTRTTLSSYRTTSWTPARAWRSIKYPKAKPSRTVSTLTSRPTTSTAKLLG
jgi:hypothetical protein